MNIGQSWAGKFERVSQSLSENSRNFPNFPRRYEKKIVDNHWYRWHILHQFVLCFRHPVLNPPLAWGTLFLNITWTLIEALVIFSNVCTNTDRITHPPCICMKIRRVNCSGVDLTAQYRRICNVISTNNSETVKNHNKYSFYCPGNRSVNSGDISLKKHTHTHSGDFTRWTANVRASASFLPAYLSLEFHGS